MTVDVKLLVAGIERRVTDIEHNAPPFLAQRPLNTAPPTTALAHGAAMDARHCSKLDLMEVSALGAVEAMEAVGRCTWM